MHNALLVPRQMDKRDDKARDRLLIPIDDKFMDSFPVSTIYARCHSNLNDAMISLVPASFSLTKNYMPKI